MTSNTRALIASGIIVGPFYLLVGIVQGLLRDGFSFARHPLSVLSNGSAGWIQTANFILSGLMVIAAAVGIARALGPKTRAFRFFLATFGMSMLAAAICTADPMDGFPVGTPLGPPTSMTTRGLLHFVFGALGFVSLAISCFFARRPLVRHDEAALARLSWISGVIVLLGFFGGFALPMPTFGIWVAVVVGWAWLALISKRLHLKAHPSAAVAGPRGTRTRQTPQE